MSTDDGTGGFRSLGEFLVRVRKACASGIKDSRLLRKTAGHMEIGDDSQGGYLVPEQWAKEIYSVALEDAIVRPRATVLKATSDSLKVRRMVETSRVSSLFGGITFRWLEEAGSKAYRVSKPALGELELTPHKLVGGCFVSNELEADYGKFGDFMKISFGRALRFIEDDSFINGTGVNQPMGVINSGALITVPRAQANSILYDDVVGMALRLLPDSWNRAVWIMNSDTLEEIFRLDTVEAGVVSVVNVNDRKLLGLPIIVSEKAYALGTTGDLLLADFSHYVIADREMTIDASRDMDYLQLRLQNYEHVGFVTDETFWRVVLRVDGQPIMGDPITPYRGANTVSAFVVLAAQVS